MPPSRSYDSMLAPVIGRELRRAWHRNKSTKSRFRVALMGAGIVVLFLLFFSLVGSAGWGRNLHQMLFLSGLYLAVVPAIRLSAGLFSEERSKQTLELLFLTGMGPAELFVGKLLGGALIASSDLLALAPFLAMPFFMGGITLDLYLATLACLPSVLLFALAVGVLASVLFKDDGAASLFSVVFAAGLSLAAPIPYYLGQMLTGGTPFSSKWLCLSPAYAAYLVSINSVSARPREFWTALFATFAWSVLCMALACFVLGRNWRTEVRTVGRAGEQGLGSWIYGRPAFRTSLRRRLLAVNPFQWLVQQERRPVLLAWATVGCICLLWLIGWGTWRRAWLSTANFFITAMVLIWIVNGHRLFAAARRIGTDRREGNLELLLTTSLSPEEMVDGEMAALAAQFKPLQRFVFGLLLLMILGGFMIRSWNLRAAITYLLVWCALCLWCLRTPNGRMLKVMWAALNTGRPAYSAFQRRGNKWSYFWIFYNIRNLINSGFSGSAAGFPSGSVVEFIVVCIISVPAVAIYYLGQAARGDLENQTRRRLIMEMRLIATEPLPDPNDPSFEKWDNVERQEYWARWTQSQSEWPSFVDPIENALPPSQGHLATPPPVLAPRAIELQDALDLFQALEKQQVDYVLAGGLAMDAYLDTQTTKNAALLMSVAELDRVRALQFQERKGFLCYSQFRGIRVLVYLTDNPFFQAIQSQFRTKLNIGGMELPALNVEGLIASKLYALYLISRQRDFYRNDGYEKSIIALLARHQVMSEPLLDTLSAHVPPQNFEELKDTFKQCQRYAMRLGRREEKTPNILERVHSMMM